MNFRELLEKTREEYRTYSPVFCPALTEHVVFNSDGFGHLLFRLRGKERNRTEQVLRLSFVPLVQTVISLAPGFEYRERIGVIHESGTSRRRFLKQVRYWGVELPIGNQRIRVVLRKIGNGRLHFWSVMRAW